MLFLCFYAREWINGRNKIYENIKILFMLFYVNIYFFENCVFVKQNSSRRRSVTQLGKQWLMPENLSNRNTEKLYMSYFVLLILTDRIIIFLVSGNYELSLWKRYRLLFHNGVNWWLWRCWLVFHVMQVAETKTRCERTATLIKIKLHIKTFLYHCMFEWEVAWGLVSFGEGWFRVGKSMKIFNAMERYFKKILFG